MSTPVSSFSRLQELLPELFQAKQITGTSYLRGQLTPKINVLLPMISVQESLLINEEQITSIPNMPEYFVGLITSRDNVFALIDLPYFLGLTNQIVQSRRIYHSVIVRFSDSSSSEKELLLGFVFHQIQGVTRIKSGQIQSIPPNLPSSLKPYLGGAITDQEQTLSVLDLTSIVNKIMQR